MHTFASGAHKGNGHPSAALPYAATRPTTLLEASTA